MTALRCEESTLRRDAGLNRLDREACLVRIALLLLLISLVIILVVLLSVFVREDNYVLYIFGAIIMFKYINIIILDIHIINNTQKYINNLKKLSILKIKT